MEYFKTDNRFMRFDNSAGQLLTIENGSLNRHISIQIIEENRRNSMSTMLSTNNTIITESEFNAVLESAKTTINSL